MKEPSCSGGDVSPQGRYAVESILRACDILEAFQLEGECLRLSEIVERTGLTKARAFRILTTLQSRNLIRRAGRTGYRLAIKPLQQRAYRLGYAMQSTEFAFSRDVTESIERTARKENVELVVVDNRYSSRIALRNADFLAKEKVDLVIEFQTDEHIAPAISSKFAELNIPMIAIEIPHPGATYYGANNFGAGLWGGLHLGQWAKQFWNGEVEEILLLELRMAGQLPRSRLTGLLTGIRRTLPSIPESAVITLDGNGQFGASLEATRKHLRKGPPKRTLIGGMNDPSTLGALRAFEEAGWTSYCAAMGQNASAEARAELRRPTTRLIGSVAYFPERYGEDLIPLAFDILNRKPVPPAVFAKHKLITRENVDHDYANDAIRYHDMGVLL